MLLAISIRFTPSKSIQSMRSIYTMPVMAAMIIPLMSFHAPIELAPKAPVMIQYPLRPNPPNLPILSALEEAPVLTPQVIRMRVTACSPGDPKDVEYYKANGYEGALNNIAADLKKFPRGTLMRVPGYMEKSAPGKYWEVDSAGGSVIRRSSRQGISHIDVKFRSSSTAINWGSKWINVEVITPVQYERWLASYNVWDKKREAFLKEIDYRDRLRAAYKDRYMAWSARCEEIRKANNGY